MSFLAPPKQQAPKASPVTPRLSDNELTARDEAAKLRKRAGIEDNILSLGRRGSGAAGGAGGGTGDRAAQRYTSLLGRTAA